MTPRTPDHRAASRPRRGLVALAALLALAMVSSSADARPRRRKPKPAPARPVPAAKPAPAPTPTPVGGDEGSADTGDAGAPGKPGKGKLKELDFRGLDLTGRQRTPQLLYFLERASAELEAAFLERRSFIPEMLRSLDEERL